VAPLVARPKLAPPRTLDLGSSPTLARIVEVVGEAVALKLVAERGGTDIFLPAKVTARCALVDLVGDVKTARALVEAFGAGHLSIPTGRGFGHGRRIDHAEVRRLHAPPPAGEGWSADAIALHLGCTARQVWNILGGPKVDPRQHRLF